MLTPLNVPALLRRFNLKPKRSLGQNFLVDEGALAKVTAAAELTPADTVLEIGPGLGGLTRHLAEAAARVSAVELDQSLLAPLHYVLTAYANVEIIHGDILDLQPSTFNLPPAYKVVANIPYYITSAVIRHLLEAEARPERMVLTVQKEVAQRMCAAPGEMSLLAVSVQFYSAPRIVARLAAGAFYPRPEVDSAVVRLDVHAHPVVEVADVNAFFRVVKAGFNQKRKQLRNALSGGLGLSGEATEALLAQANIDPKRRAETLALEEWASLTRAFASARLSSPKSES